MVVEVRPVKSTDTTSPAFAWIASSVLQAVCRVASLCSVSPLVVLFPMSQGKLGPVVNGGFSLLRAAFLDWAKSHPGHQETAAASRSSGTYDGTLELLLGGAMKSEYLAAALLVIVAAAIGVGVSLNLPVTTQFTSREFDPAPH